MTRQHSYALILAVIAAFGLLTPATSSAAMVSFGLVESTGSTGIDVDLTIRDGADSAQAGYLEAFLQVDTSTGVTGDLLGLFVSLINTPAGFDVTNYTNETDFMNTGGSSYVIGSAVTDVGAGTRAGPGNNLNGVNLMGTTFELNFTFNGPGSSTGLLTSTSVFLRDLTVPMVEAAGVRVQTVGAVPNGGGGSAKLFGFPTTTPPPPDPEAVPEPATMTLLGGALLGLAMLRRKKQ